MVEKTQIGLRHFWCYDCHGYWQTDDYTVDGDSAFSKCLLCHRKCHDVPHYFSNLPKMHLNATGPKTDSGKKRSSMNGYRTGLNAKKAFLLAPANHNKYSQCKDCEYSRSCKNKELKYCPVILDPMLKFLAAFENGNIDELKQFAAFSQGKTFLALQNIYAAIFDKGVIVKSVHPEFTELKSNPVIKYIPELMAVLGFTSDQQQMNPKNDPQTDDDQKGSLDDIEHVGDFIKGFLRKVNTAVDNVKNLKPAAERGDKAAEAEKAEIEIPEGPIHNPFKK